MSAARDCPSHEERAVALLVHTASVPYIQSVVAYIRQQLSSHLSRPPLYFECSDVSATELPVGTLAFVIGDGFPRFERRPGCRYVFVNFSLVRKLRWWRPLPWAATRWIRSKQRGFAATRELYDMVLDFHPRQTRLLQREVAGRTPIRHFMTGVVSAADRCPQVPLSLRQWDVCLVGTDSSRRARLRGSLESLDVRVSPATASSLDEVLQQCRLVANVHFAPCDTLEAPRVIHALSAGVCLVTEPCYRLEEIATADCYFSVPYRHMPATIARLLRDPTKLEDVSARAVRHMKTEYAARAAESWRAILQEAMEL
jgi:hypothetical protein